MIVEIVKVTVFQLLLLCLFTLVPVIYDSLTRREVEMIQFETFFSSFVDNFYLNSASLFMGYCALGSAKLIYLSVAFFCFIIYMIDYACFIKERIMLDKKLVIIRYIVFIIVIIFHIFCVCIVLNEGGSNE